MRAPLEKALKNVCRIESLCNGAPASGQGVFIGPGLVLTALHVVEPSLRNITVVANNSKSTTLSEVIPLKYAPEMDLCIATLKDPINGEEFSTVRIWNTEPAKISHGFLLTRFNKEAACHRAIVDYDLTVMNESKTFERTDKTTMAIFKSTVQAVPGYSGSPVVDDNGQIISIAWGIVPLHQNHAIAVYNFLHSITKVGTEPLIPFLGPSPSNLAQFMRSVLFQLSPPVTRPAGILGF